MKWFSTLAFAACVAWAHAAAAQPIPIEAFGRLPAVADVAISPDGRRVAVATSQTNGQGAVLIIDLDQTSERSAYGVGENMHLRAVGWADNERVSYLVSQTFQPGAVLPAGWYFRGTPRRVDYSRWGTINTRTGRATMLRTNAENEWAELGADLIAPIEGDDGYGRMIGSNTNWDRRNAALYRIDLDNSRAWRLQPVGVNDDTVDYVIDRQGNVVGRLDRDPSANRWRLFAYDRNTPRLLFEETAPFGNPISIRGLLPDGRFVMRRANEAGYNALYAISRATGEAQSLASIGNVEVSATITDPWTREIVGGSWTEVETMQTFFDPALESARQAVAGALQGAAFRIETWSADRSRFIVYAERGLDGGAYYLFDAATSTLRFLSARYPDLVQTALGVRQSITYAARDGERVPAYLTLPAGAEARNLPLVVLVHGGPHARETMDFDWWSTFLVSRGYAVLQPNFRGSSGYGQAWEDAGRREWGGLMQTDVEDGAAAVVRAGIADESRICIVGGSYGGYSALAGATLTPDRYRCAVSVAGVSDLPLMLSQIERQTGDESSSTYWWRASIGDRQEDRERIRAVSPAYLADRVQIPILLIHGTDDTVVPIEQSRRMQRALNGAGKDVRFVELRGDDHWLSDAPTRIQMLREIETFLAEQIGAPR